MTVTSHSPHHKTRHRSASHHLDLVRYFISLRHKAVLSCPTGDGAVLAQSVAVQGSDDRDAVTFRSTPAIAAQIVARPEIVLTYDSWRDDTRLILNGTARVRRSLLPPWGRRLLNALLGSRDSTVAIEMLVESAEVWS